MKVESLHIDYVGVKNPETPQEVAIEISGLKLAIKCAEQRIALLEQGLVIAKAKATIQKNEK